MFPFDDVIVQSDYSDDSIGNICSMEIVQLSLKPILTDKILKRC